LFANQTNILKMSQEVTSYIVSPSCFLSLLGSSFMITSFMIFGLGKGIRKVCTDTNDNQRKI
jgi:hypothetical protein